MGLTNRIETEIDSFECIRCLEQNEDVVPRISALPSHPNHLLKHIYYRLNPAYGLEDYKELDWMNVVIQAQCNYCG